MRADHFIAVYQPDIDALNTKRGRAFAGDQFDHFLAIERTGNRQPQLTEFSRTTRVFQRRLVEAGIFQRHANLVAQVQQETGVILADGLVWAIQ